VRFFIDHDVPAEVARVLRRERHEVTELREVLPVTAVDLDALKYANEHGLFLVTCNRDDFLALVAAHPNPGLIVLIRRRSRQAECGNLLTLLREAGENGIAGNVNFA
jgi:predicted nuclease of predicted toxin-antitoxin system